MKTYLAMDVGGTNVNAGLADDGGLRVGVDEYQQRYDAQHLSNPL